MQQTIRTFYSTGVSALLLAMLLNWNPLALQAQAHAQEMRGGHVRISAQRARTHSIEESILAGRGIVLTGNLRFGGVIIVSLSQQHLYAFENGEEVFDTPVLTGQPSLPTPIGTYRIFRKVSPTVFRSPFSRHSRFWYPPTRINYAMEFRAGGYYLHDSWWHTVYGAGTEYRHYDPRYGWQSGSHGCVSMPLDAAQWLYSWAPVGTVVRIQR